MKKKYPFFTRNEKMATRYRCNLTPPEQKLWDYLSKDIALSKYLFRAQEPILNYILDFYSPILNFAIEVDGKYHQFRKNRFRDKDRDGRLQEEAGILVLRIPAKSIFAEFSEVIIHINNTISYLEKLDIKSPLLRYKHKSNTVRKFTFEEKLNLIKELESRGKINKKRYTPC